MKVGILLFLFCNLLIIIFNIKCKFIIHKYIKILPDILKIFYLIYWVIK